MNLIRLVAAAAMLALISGCATQQGGVGSEPAPVEERAATGVETNAGAQAGGASAAGGYTSADLDNPASLLSQRVIYFAFDSNDISPDAAAVLEAHSRYLAAHPEVRVSVEGHTDERGSQEYNLALGERRAEAVKRVLLLNGALANQIQSVSFGEEKPAMEGSNEAAWSQNRRAELVYQR
ncbi:MAG TPA: peptidoglycan-associated lipoprotein Pal [Gammaproteobacteria bacterium]|nr:peptidoglycan-associated lipoprotein Pal [Gammaproteobacteria bacterium]